jgi:predicted nucleic acid-binding protein
LIYVDSNYWIYWLDGRLPEHKRVLPAMREAIESGILMNYVTLMEIGHYLRRLPYRAFIPKIEMILNLSTLVFADLDDRITRSAMEMLPRYSGKGLGVRDCVVIATMLDHELKDIMTHDIAFSRIADIRHVDILTKP